MGYKGSQSFEHVPSDPPKRDYAESRRRKLSATSVGTPPALPDSPVMFPALSSESALPGVSTAKKRRLEDSSVNVMDGGQAEEELSFSEPENKSNRNWELAYREAKLAYLDMKGSKLETKGHLIAKDSKILEKDAKIHQLEGQVKQEINQLKQEINRLKQVVNQRDQTTNELEGEAQSFKVKISEMTAYTHYLNNTVANVLPKRRPHAPTHVLSLDKAISDSLDYRHPNAPREALKDYRRFQPTLSYASGNGKVGPGKYGSNTFWDLGLCHVHYQTPHVCQHGAACEYRHGPLTYDERSYIRFLTKGNEFLRRSDEIIMRKTKG